MIYDTLARWVLIQPILWAAWALTAGFFGRDGPPKNAFFGFFVIVVFLPTILAWASYHLIHVPFFRLGTFFRELLGWLRDSSDKSL